MSLLKFPVESSEITTLENSKGKLAQLYQQINCTEKQGSGGFSTKSSLKGITKGSVCPLWGSDMTKIAKCIRHCRQLWIVG